MKYFIWIASSIALLTIVSCRHTVDSPRGFSLPEGNVSKGERAFMHYECLACHSLKGYEDAEISKVFQTPVPLGGKSTAIKTYAELVTSIINPSHKISSNSRLRSEAVTEENGQSKMTKFNEVMTVQELIDIVAFLQPKYEVKPVIYTHYGYYREP